MTCVYVLYDEKGECLYVGSTIDTQSRFYRHRYIHLAARIDKFPCEASDRRVKEQEMIDKLNPRLNKNRAVCEEPSKKSYKRPSPFVKMECNPEEGEGEFCAADVIEMIDEKLAIMGTQKEVANSLGISAQHLCDILLGKRELGPKVLKGLGIERVVTYRVIRKDVSA